MLPFLSLSKIYRNPKAEYVWGAENQSYSVSMIALMMRIFTWRILCTIFSSRWVSGIVELKCMPPVFLFLRFILGGGLLSRIPTLSNSRVKISLWAWGFEASRTISKRSALLQTAMTCLPLPSKCNLYSVQSEKSQKQLQVMQKSCLVFATSFEILGLYGEDLSSRDTMEKNCDSSLFTKKEWIIENNVWRRAVFSEWAVSWSSEIFSMSTTVVKTLRRNFSKGHCSCIIWISRPIICENLKF